MAARYRILNNYRASSLLRLNGLLYEYQAVLCIGVRFLSKRKKNGLFLHEGLASQKNALIIRSPEQRKRC